MKVGKGEQLIVFKRAAHEAFLPKPIPASQALPDWYKQAPTSTEGRLPWEGDATFKSCMPMFDAMIQGYIIPLCSDVYVGQRKDGETGEMIPDFRWRKNEEPVIGIHYHYQTKDVPLLDKSSSRGPAFKFESHWIIETPKGYSTLFIPPLNNANPNFETLSAIVATDSYHDFINFPFVWTAPDGWEGVIPQGTPICQAIPFKRDDFQHKIDFITPDDENLIRSTRKALNSKFRSVYKDLWRKMVKSI